ncbi:hypothetical protein [Enterococcus rivorum]|nr:hypothetical protein [Enterococcus rivorum]MBP2100082.1 hypothetical protein [Enterococcus rivorum]
MKNGDKEVKNEGEFCSLFDFNEKEHGAIVNGIGSFPDTVFFYPVL